MFGACRVQRSDEGHIGKMTPRLELPDTMQASLCVAEYTTRTLVAGDGSEGGRRLVCPCRITSPNPHDPVLLVLWYRNASVTPPPTGCTASKCSLKLEVVVKRDNTHPTPDNETSATTQASLGIRVGGVCRRWVGD
ncbi:hypothetical protein Pmani_037493 [Petrolisthes manimaculis]|uniref:Uncharacterized protein n=1 Tax=Petrolisthes manimaculis TaxID=1843537 RepID=A0AAE1NGN4_9EUCA|nr:hypothetical protein Pmani_037493 [Petrolisthes manimaculis]